ncbi:hypothetical protein GCM10027456_74700 [Kineosporia babensis]
MNHGLSVLRTSGLLERALRRAGIVPDGIAGSSVGEWSALVASGALARQPTAELFEEVDTASLEIPDLLFAAVGMPASTVLGAFPEGSGVVVSHDNAPAQSIVCGPAEPVRQTLPRLRAAGVLAQELPFRSGFHTPMFAPYLAPFEEFARLLTPGRAEVELWSGTTASRVGPGEEQIRRTFLGLLLHPVRLREMIGNLYDAGYRAFVQVGLGQLPSLVTQTLGNREHLSITAAAANRDGLGQLARVSAALWVEGYEQGNRRSAADDALIGLDLGTPLVSLTSAQRLALRNTLDHSRPEPAAAVLTGPVPTGPVLAGASGGTLEAEWQALAEEFAQTARIVQLAATQPATATQPAAPTPPVPPIPPALPTTLAVNVTEMPYLLDHCFFRQRPGWPDVSDRRPIVPGTSIIWHMSDLVSRSRPGSVVTRLRDLRLTRWLAAAPGVEVPIQFEPQATDVRVAFGDYSTAVLSTAPVYPSPPPAVWPVDLASERPLLFTASEMYDLRLMFHGKQFQGVSELTALGPRHVRGAITTPAAPGALLDCAGQILGSWIISTFTTRTRVLPVGLDGITWYGPPPPTGASVGCHARITHLDENTVKADIQLTLDGVVWAELNGWQNRRFDNHPQTQAVENWPEFRALSTPSGPSGELPTRVELFERWGDLGSRDLVMRNHLSSAERAEFEALSPVRRRGWLLERIAAKDAVRHLLWSAGQNDPAPVFPAEIRVEEASGGQVRLSGLHGRELPPISVTVTQACEFAVARLSHGDQVSPIAVVEVTGDPQEARARAVATVVRHYGEATGQAVEGYREQPAGTDSTRVALPYGELMIDLDQVRNPPDLPERDYLVAWLR